MGKTRLHVKFDHGHIGKFIDWRDAEITGVSISVASNDNTSTNSGDDVEQLSQLLEHMAFTTATLISSEHSNPQRMEHLLHAFERQVRNHAIELAHTRTSPTNTRPATRPSINRVPPEEL
jgi:hypothetical protein